MNPSKNGESGKNYILLRKLLLGAFSLVFIGGLVALSLSNIDIFDFMSRLVLDYHKKFGIMGIFLAIFLISTFANGVIIFPIPYTILLVQVIVLIPEFHNFGMILLLGVVGGFGSGIGEITGYILGKASGEIIKETELGKHKLERWHKYNENGWTLWIVFLLAATPLPDDAFLLFLGMLSFPIMKMIIVCTLGKIVQMLIMGAIAFFIFINPIIPDNFADFALMLFSLERDPISNEILIGESNATLSAIIFGGSLLVIGLIIFVDWEKIFNKREITLDEEIKNETDTPSLG